MANHQRNRDSHRFVALGPAPALARPTAGTVPSVDEDEVALDVDEPPDRRLPSGRQPIEPANLRWHDSGYVKHPPALTPKERKQSLITQALMTELDLGAPRLALSAPMSRARSNASTRSLASTAELTSDGGANSPARSDTPSPPLPAVSHVGLAMVPTKDLDDPTEGMPLAPVEVVAAPPRKRAITFACGAPPKPKAEADARSDPQPPPPPPKRSCVLRFACPSKPAREVEDGRAPVPPVELRREDSQSTVRQVSPGSGPARSPPSPSSPPSSPETARSEALRFHEFASARKVEEGWLSERPTPRPKLTVDDTLRKENAIRKLGREAEQEALDEEDEDEDEEEEDEDEDDVDVDEEDGPDMNGEENASDGGNESDDEDGFAESDDDSDADPEYRFWTSTITTAATSADHLEHIRPRHARTASESSLESIVDGKGASTRSKGRTVPGRSGRRRRPSPAMRPCTPELPDSTDFVCGTLDEDRALETAYLSCLEQRKIARHGIIPQDVDPSFPTSDPENDDDEEEEEEEDEDDVEASDSQVWAVGRFDASDDDDDRRPRGRENEAPGKVVAAPPRPPPKRLHSPPPRQCRRSPAPAAGVKRGTCRSPPPPLSRRPLAGSPRRTASPPPARALGSSPPSRRTSPRRHGFVVDVPLPTRRGPATHAKSLPFTPNPFWSEHRRRLLAALDDADEDASPAAAEPHSRGPIDIVQGLESRRQRRKEKYWRQHCRDAKRDKDRPSRPGKGAKRMRELGLEVADRAKAFGPRTQVVLSI